MLTEYTDRLLHRESPVKNKNEAKVELIDENSKESTSKKQLSDSKNLKEKISQSLHEFKKNGMIKGDYSDIVNSSANNKKDGISEIQDKKETVRTPNVNTKTIRVEEAKAPTAIKERDVLKNWDDYLGENQHDINPKTGEKDPDRIFSADSTRSVRFANHEMRSIGTTKAHYHLETWMYDPINDIMTVTNLQQRIRK